LSEHRNYTDEIESLLDRADKLSKNGSTREKLVQHVIDLADRHQDRHYQRLARSYYMSLSLPRKFNNQLVHFAKILSLTRDYPSQKFNLFLIFEYFMIIEKCVLTPLISRDHIIQILDEAEERNLSEGYSSRRINEMRSDIMVSMGDQARALEYFKRSKKDKGRYGLHDCRSCQKNRFFKYFIFQGNDENALKAVEPILNEKLSCPVNPSITFCEMLMILLKLGKKKRAVRLFRHFYSFNKDYIPDLIRFTALTRSDAIALNHFEDYVGKCFTIFWPAERFNFFLEATLLFRSLQESGRRSIKLNLKRSCPLYRPSGSYSLKYLIGYFENESRKLADRFNLRNGNNHFTELIEQNQDLLGYRFKKAVKLM